MGNCQAAEVSAVAIQHPGGKMQRLYWPTTAEEVMKSNPGHHVALVTTLCIAQAKQHPDSSGDGGGGGHARFTRVRLLKPKDMLLIGQVYRLVTSQEVSKAVKARKLEKMRETQSESMEKQRQQQQQQIQNARVDHRIQFGQEAGRIESGRTNDHHQFLRQNDTGRKARKGAAEERSQLTAAALAADAAEHLGECELISSYACLLER